MPALHPHHVGLDVIHTHSAGLAELIAASPADVLVPTCGDWTLSDLAWHMVEVQDFWVHVIGSRPATPTDYVEPDRPADAELAERLGQATTDLIAALTVADPADEAWSWAVEHTVAFTLRRQSHEALVHHLDAVLAVGAPLPDIATELAADGVDEMTGVFLSETPDWASFTRSDGVIELSATDTGDSWTFAFGRMVGTSPRTGKDHDLDAVVAVEGESPDTALASDALSLDLWLWGRAGTADLRVTGDGRLVERLRNVAVESTQ